MQDTHEEKSELTEYEQFRNELISMANYLARILSELQQDDKKSARELCYMLRSDIDKFAKKLSEDIEIKP